MPKARRSHIGFRLDGIEPKHDLAWHLAGPRGRKAFWSEAARYALKVKDKSIARGLGVDGQALAEITQRTRDHRHSAMGRAYRNAPPLTPARRLSRTRSYLRAHVEDDGVWLFWRFDHRTGMSWGRILQYQADRGRDVIGLSDADRGEIGRHMAWWWKRYRVKVAVAGAVARAVPPMTLTGHHAGLVRPPVAVGADLRDVLTEARGDKRQMREAAARGTFSGVRRSPGPATTGPFVRRKAK